MNELLDILDKNVPIIELKVVSKINKIVRNLIYLKIEVSNTNVEDRVDLNHSMIQL